MIFKVVISFYAKRQLQRLPKYIAENVGLENVRLIRGYHDEPLHGHRKGQRSIRLNRAYRAIYEIRNDGTIEFVSIEEVTKHDY